MFSEGNPIVFNHVKLVVSNKWCTHSFQPLIFIKMKVQSLLLETIKLRLGDRIHLSHPTQSIAPDQALHEDFLANEQFSIAIGITPITFHTQNYNSKCQLAQFIPMEQNTVYIKLKIYLMVSYKSASI